MLCSSIRSCRRAAKSNTALLLVVMLLQVALAPAAAAQAIVSTGQSFVESEILVGARTPAGERDAGLKLTVEEGWKTYWRSPGEAGVPPSFDWSRSENLADVEIDWPVPEVFESFGLRTVGYSGTVVLPLRLTAKDPAQPIGLALDLSLGVCREICVLEEAELEARITPDAPGSAAARIEAARAARPLGGTAAGIRHVSCRLSGAGKDRALRATIELDRSVANPYVALEIAGEDGWFHGTSVNHEGDGLVVESTLSLSSENAWIDRSSVRMTVLDTRLAAEVRGCSAG